MQCTNEYESHNIELIFLDVTIRNNENYSYDFAVYHKPTIANVQMKPHSSISSHITMGVFKKGFHPEHWVFAWKNIWIKKLDC